MGGPEEAEGLSDAMTRSLFHLESLTVYFCLTCGELAALPSETDLEHRWKENQEAGSRGKHRRTDRKSEGLLADLRCRKTNRTKRPESRNCHDHMTAKNSPIDTHTRHMLSLCVCVSKLCCRSVSVQDKNPPEKSEANVSGMRALPPGALVTPFGVTVPSRCSIDSAVVNMIWR